MSPIRIPFRICLSLLLPLLLILPRQVCSQDLDSLMANKRVYATLSIGDGNSPKIDGHLSDPVWEMGSWHGSFTQQQPVTGVPASEQTRIKVLYDHSNLYVAIVCGDSEPAQIRDIFDRRDALGGDMTGIAIDSYFDKRTAFEFNLSAAGQKMDLKHLGDYQWDFNWDAVWDGATARNDTGWVAEMRIPFSQLRYSNREDHIWGMHVWRWIARKAEEDQWQLIPREAPAMVYLFGELHGVKNIRSSRMVEFLPYGVVRLEHSPGSEGPGTPGTPGVQGGLDAKVGISSDYTLDLSVNPDFGQVEADPAVLNLTSYETFYQEKRPFFLEGNEIFDFTLGQDIPYYSRRIGSAPAVPEALLEREISDLPLNTTILGAAKVTGRSRKGLSVGIMNGLTAGEEASLTGEGGMQEPVSVASMSNYLASRVKQEFREGSTVAGGMIGMVSRFHSDSLLSAVQPGMAFSGGVDFLHYWNNRNYFVEAKAIASQLSGTREAILEKQYSHVHRFQRPDAGYLAIDSTREQLTGHGGLIRVGKKGGSINFGLTGEYRSPGLNLNDLGYIRQADLAGQTGELSYRMNEPRKWIRNYELKLSQELFWSFGGENTHNELQGSFTLMDKRLWQYELLYRYEFHRLETRVLRGGPALMLDPRQQWAVSLVTNSSKDLWGAAGIHIMADHVPGSVYSLYHGRITWLPFRRMKLALLPSYEDRTYHQQYIATLSSGNRKEYVVGKIDQQTLSFTLRAELFMTAELSLQYYGNPFFSVGDYGRFRRVDRAGATSRDSRLDPLNEEYLEETDSYRYSYGGETWEFGNPDFTFMQYRSNLVFRWEYHLGSTLYLVWSHDRSGWESAYRPVGEITGGLAGLGGKNIFMLKVNFWFSV